MWLSGPRRTGLFLQLPERKAARQVGDVVPPRTDAYGRYLPETWRKRLTFRGGISPGTGCRLASSRKTAPRVSCHGAAAKPRTSRQHGMTGGRAADFIRSRPCRYITTVLAMPHWLAGKSSWRCSLTFPMPSGSGPAPVRRGARTRKAQPAYPIGTWRGLFVTGHLVDRPLNTVRRGKSPGKVFSD
jgi:hypothetical protein